MSVVNRLVPRPFSVLEILKSLASLHQWHALRLFGLAQLDWSASRRARRAVAWGRPVPWWSYGCTSFVDQVISPQKSVLDIGSGASTLWWLERGNQVVALESNPKWGEEVSEIARQDGFELEMSVGLLSDLISNLIESRPVPFDVVCIDNEGDRFPIVEAVLPLVAETGVIIFDDIDRTRYSTERELLASHGFGELTFHGLGPVSAFAWSTSFFSGHTGLV